jgi:hypothetical protein
MSHTITAFCPDSHTVAVLRISEGTIYNLLKVPEFNLFKSGSGESKIFSKEDLKTALVDLKAIHGKYKHIDLYDFLVKCTDCCNDEGIQIEFA